MDLIVHYDSLSYEVFNLSSYHIIIDIIDDHEQNGAREIESWVRVFAIQALGPEHEFPTAT